MSYNNDFGPKWVVNSEEVGSGAALALALFAAAFVLAPAFLIALAIGQSIWNARIFKYPFALFLTYQYYRLLAYVWTVSHEGAAAMVILSWVFLDYALANGKVKDMFICKTTKKTLGWLFGA